MTAPDGPVHVAEVYTAYQVGRKTYWRTATVTMACVQFNATQPKTGHHLAASWEQKPWGAKVLRIEEFFPVKAKEIA